MSTPTSPYQTFSDIYNAVIKDAKESTSTQIVTLVKRWINEGNEQIAMSKKRDWLDTQFAVQLTAAVQADCTVTENSTTVTFTPGTTFTAGIDLQFYNQGFPEVYNVTSATLNVVKLDKAYLGTTATAVTGVVFQPSVVLDPTIRTIYQAYHQYNSAPLTQVGPQQFRQLQEAYTPQLDYATYGTIFGQDSSGSRRLFFYPYPLNAYTLYLDSNVFPTQLVSSTDQPQIPIQYRQILYWYALYKLYLYHRNSEFASAALGSYKSMLAQIDAETRAELDFPQIAVKYPRGKNLRTYSPPFNPLWRWSN
jgi:hypothetical protein